MKKNHFFTYSKMCMLALTGAGTLFLVSCAKDGFDEESFDSGVSNTQVASLANSNLTRVTSTDGKSQTFTWPVVMGAGGYRVNLVDLGNPDAPIINDSIVDGCSVTASHEEDINYHLTVLPLGNAKKNNTNAVAGIDTTYYTGAEKDAIIPAGNLNDWFAANPVPDKGLTEPVVYDLEGGQEYKVSAALDFDNKWVTLRSNNKTNPAKIIYTSTAACITTTAGMTIKYLHFDCSEQSKSRGVFGFSETTSVPAANTVNPDLYKYSGALITNPIAITNCTFDNVRSYFFWDNKVKTWAETVVVDNCVVHLAPQEAIGGGVFWTNKAGHINNLTVTNSTFYELPDCTNDIKYFYQAGLTKAPDLYVDKTPEASTATNSVTYSNCTFYHIAWNGGQWGNYNGMQGKDYSYWTLTNCIFYDCSNAGGVARRFVHGQNNPKHATFNYNTYMNTDGTFQESTTYDKSGTIIEEDPGFADPANAIFTISASSKQASIGTGDPRWLPTNE